RAAILSPRLYSLGGGLGRWGLRALYSLGLAGTIFDPLRRWNRHRAPMPLPGKSFRAQWKKENRT
ncbi:MAG TPA: hypothetical protein VKL40_01545, partial [Candidatus Angelobacter sp.]|nr:hypothetical protein [Candidatus Angelobacter sp.]